MTAPNGLNEVNVLVEYKNGDFVGDDKDKNNVFTTFMQFNRAIFILNMIPKDSEVIIKYMPTLAINRASRTIGNYLQSSDKQQSTTETDNGYDLYHGFICDSYIRSSFVRGDYTDIYIENVPEYDNKVYASDKKKSTYISFNPHKIQIKFISIPTYDATISQEIINSIPDAYTRNNVIRVSNKSLTKAIEDYNNGNAEIEAGLKNEHIQYTHTLQYPSYVDPPYRDNPDRYGGGKPKYRKNIRKSKKHNAKKSKSTRKSNKKSTRKSTRKNK